MRSAPASARARLRSARQGEDAEVIDAEQAADNKRADDAGLRYDSDGRHTRRR
jgi:capsid protein